MNATASKVILFVWTALCLGALGVLFASPITIITADYHPNVAYAPYVLPGTLGCLAFLLCSAVLATRFAITGKHHGNKTRAKEAGGLVLTGVLALLALPIVVSPVPDTFTQYAGHNAYTIPRVFTELAGNQPGKDASVVLAYCQDSFTGIYEKHAEACISTRTSLSQRPITSEFSAQYLLDNRLNVPRRGDQILDTAPLRSAMTVARSGRLTTYTTVPSTGRAASEVHHIVLDDHDRIILFASCATHHPRCQIASKTSEGTLSYTFVQDHHLRIEAWKPYERRVLNLLHSWQTRSS
ncbi:MAG: hypothetical protein AAGF81_14560 [Pseudomonadota bacterium]